MVDTNISAREYFRIGLFTYIIPSSVLDHATLESGGRRQGRQDVEGAGGGGPAECFSWLTLFALPGKDCVAGISWCLVGLFAVGTWLVIYCFVPILSGGYFRFLNIFR